MEEGQGAALDPLGPKGPRPQFIKINWGLLIGFLLTACAAPAPVHVTSAPHSETPVCGCILRQFLVHFDSGSFQIPPNDRQYVADAEAYYLQQKIKPPFVEIVGHTDASEGDDNGHGLSLHRAVAVENLIVEDGVPRSKVWVKAAGDTQPMIPNPSNAKELQNRFVIISMD